MLRERVSADIYVFTSDLYAQVTSSIIVTPEGVVMIDSMPFPTEAQEIAAFVTHRLSTSVRYLILTHYHADHTYGAYLFPQACILAHDHCRQFLLTRGEEGLAAARAEAVELEAVDLRLPQVTLDDGEMDLCIGGKLLRLMWTPGHSEDVISVFLEEERILFASDAVMPVPTIIDGDLETLKNSLRCLMELQPECVVQGHGEVILRGEVQSILQISIDYLDKIHELTAKAIARGKSLEELLAIDIETCGLSRVALNGQAPQLHAANLAVLYEKMIQRG
ncbi:MAG: MBL fold metallo-hydrolase [Anaerolineae bacterium]|nr:MBL fold metallo-hydrolase [Anaerolineae bacterium]